MMMIIVVFVDYLFVDKKTSLIKEGALQIVLFTPARVQMAECSVYVFFGAVDSQLN